MVVKIWASVAGRKIPRTGFDKVLAYLDPTSFVLRHELRLLDRYLSKLSRLQGVPPTEPQLLITVFENLGTKRDRRRLREGMNGQSTTFSFTLGNIITEVSQAQCRHGKDSRAILHEVTTKVTEMREYAAKRYSEHLSFRWD